MDIDGTKSYAKRYDEPFKKDTVEYWLKNRKSVKEVSEAMGGYQKLLYTNGEKTMISIIITLNDLSRHNYPGFVKKTWSCVKRGIS